MPRCVASSVALGIHGCSRRHYGSSCNAALPRVLYSSRRMTCTGLAVSQLTLFPCGAVLSKEPDQGRQGRIHIFDTLGFLYRSMLFFSSVHRSIEYNRYSKFGVSIHTIHPQRSTNTFATSPSSYRYLNISKHQRHTGVFGGPNHRFVPINGPEEKRT